MSKEKGKDVSRRTFLKSSATVAAAATGGMGYFALAGEGKGAKGFKVALIGCGGRGNGALGQHMYAGKQMGLNMKVVATADFFKNKAEGTGKRYGVPKERCFGGATGYKKLLETGPDTVLIATSPNFRPVHFEACVNAGKHVFMEKPVAVDPVGVRRIMKAGEDAKKKGLIVIAGTQRRSQKNYCETQQAVSVEKQLGEIRGGRVSWCGGRLWFKRRNAGESDASYMVRNWTSFAEMSGDHVVEQHVHNLDVANWFIGTHPLSVNAFGMRARRQTGNQYDFFSADVQYPNEVNIHSMCRQITGCTNWVGENLRYEKGSTSCHSGPKPKKAVMPEGLILHHGGNAGHQQEHFKMLFHLVRGEMINEAQNVAESTMTAIMIRMSAYTGNRVTWDQAMKSNFAMSPTAEDFEKGTVKAPKDDVFPRPGRA